MSTQKDAPFSPFVFGVFFLIFIFLCVLAILNHLQIPAAVGMVIVFGLLILYKRVPVKWRIRIKDYISIMFQQSQQ